MTANPKPDVPFPRFSQAEYDARYRRMEAIIEANELDALVIFGNVGARADIQYLTGWPPGTTAS